MNKLFITAITIGALSLSATAVMAMGGHDEGHQKGKMMERIDTNGDGVVSKEEFMAKHAEKFDKIDVDGNGSLSKEELKEAHGKMKEKRSQMREKRQERKQERKLSQE